MFVFISISCEIQTQCTTLFGPSIPSAAAGTTVQKDLCPDAQQSWQSWDNLCAVQVYDRCGNGKRNKTIHNIGSLSLQAHMLNFNHHICLLCLEIASEQSLVHIQYI